MLRVTLKLEFTMTVSVVKLNMFQRYAFVAMVSSPALFSRFSFLLLHVFLLKYFTSTSVSYGLSFTKIICRLLMFMNLTFCIWIHVPKCEYIYLFEPVCQHCKTANTVNKS